MYIDVICALYTTSQVANSKKVRIFAAKLSQPGYYTVAVELEDGWKQVGDNGRCSIAELAFTVSCADAYRQEGPSCKLDESKARLEKALGIGIGVVVALCVGLLLALIRKRPAHAKRILISFIRAGCGSSCKHHTASMHYARQVQK